MRIQLRLLGLSSSWWSRRSTRSSRGVLSLFAHLGVMEKYLVLMFQRALIVMWMLSYLTVMQLFEILAMLFILQVAL